jgi:hypothetical protein
MIDYVLFEKKPEGERPAWTLTTAMNFCEDQKYDVVEYEDSPLFVVAKLTTHTDEEKSYRLIEVTPTLTFLVEEEPSLDEFLEPEIPKDHPMTFPRIETLTIEEVKEMSC